MKRRFVAILIAALALACALAGCSSSGQSGQAGQANQAAGESDFKGFWILEEPSQLGFEVVLNLDIDSEAEEGEDAHFAELMIEDAFLEGTWSVDNGTATMKFDEDSNGKTASATLSGDKLVYGSSDGSKLVFTKGDMDAYFEAQGDDEDEMIELDGEELDGDDVEIVDEVIEDLDKPVSIAKDDTATIEVTGKGTDFTGDPGYRLSITNNTKKTITVSADDSFKVNGKSIEAGLGEMLEAGETLETFLFFSSDELGGGAEALKGVEGKIIVSEEDSDDALATYDFKMD